MASLRSLLEISLVGGIAALAGCADQGGQTLIVLHNTAPGAGCVITPNEGGTFISAGFVDAIGVLDYFSPVGYIVTPTIKNIGDSNGGALENERTVIFHGARVDLAAVDAAGVVTLPATSSSFIAPFSGSIGPDGGIAAVGFELVPVPAIAAVAARIDRAAVPSQSALITATFVVFGETTAGIKVEADPYTYPITLCVGCLLTDLGSCFGLPQGTYPGGGACNTFQDSPAACCLTSNAPQQFICPAVPEDLGT